MLAYDRNQPGQFLPDALRFHMPAFADGDVDCVKSNLRRGASEFIALHELQMLGEDGDFQFALCRGGRYGIP